MLYRWLHKSWKYFWGILLTLLLVVIVLGGSVLGVLQLDYTQKYISAYIERQVEQTYHADLSIGELDGFLPFQISMNDVVLENTADSTETDTVLSIAELDSQVDVWGLIRKKVTITGFTAQNPQVLVRSDADGRNPLLQARAGADTQSTGGGSFWFSEVDVVAPSMEIINGSIKFRSTPSSDRIGNLPHSFSLNDINATLFVDWGEQQRYLDIGSFAAETENLSFQNLFLSGQVYNDSRYLEFNSFYLSMGGTRLVLNGEIEGVDMMKANVVDQLLAARYDVGVQSSQLDPEDLSQIVPNLPKTEALYSVDLEASGTLDSLQVGYASLGTGESQITFDGFFKKLTSRDDFFYQLGLNEVNLLREDLHQVVPSLETLQYQALEDLSATGEVNGSLDSLNAALQVNSTFGSLKFEAQSQLKEPYIYSGNISGTDVDITPFAPASFDTTSLTFKTSMEGRGISLERAVSEIRSSFGGGHINNIPFEKASLNTNLKYGLVNSIYSYQAGGERLRGSASADLRKGSRELALQGNGENINLDRFFDQHISVAQTALNFEYNIQLQNILPRKLYGRANLDVRPSVINGDTVRAHQMYMDLNAPDAPTREFRLTSSLFDMNISGDFEPAAIKEQAAFWSTYLRNQFNREILLDSTSVSTLPALTLQHPVVMEGNISFRDLSLLNRYIPDFPKVQTDSEVSFSANTDGRRLLLSAGVQADTLYYEDLTFSNSTMQMSASFRTDRILKNFTTVDLEASVESLKNPSADLDSLRLDLAVKQDSISLTQQIGSISDNARFEMSLLSSLSDSSISVAVENFFMGNQQYSWTEETYPSFTYYRNGDVSFHNFRFHNRNEFFGLEGTLSKNRSDSLTYILRDISLSRISELVKGEVGFSGTLNGTLVTRSLRHQPTIQGALNVNGFRLNERIVGDISFSSRFDSDQDRFNTQIDIVTDSTKYSEYIASNDGIRQNIHLDGYFVTPEPDVVQDSLYYFDANFEQIDMWVIQLLIPSIFRQIEGQASGEGYITGNLEDFDFHSDFEARNVFAKPRFVNTNLFLSGPVQFDRQDGVVLDSLSVMDTKGGTGTVWGAIDLNDFNPLTYLDLTLDMNQLQFLNNTMDPDVPFFGTVSGSGVVRLTGSNRDMYMRTENPVRITDNSEISIPLLEETELSETGKFIRFVDSFDKYRAEERRNNTQQKQLAEEELEQALEEMTFSERFDLDLQFDAPQNITVNLIFDPVTGEILTAQGTGQMRISMQDQDVQMFGRYNINSGSYQFVTGEIISRRLQLEPGGAIVWEGAPDNARLDISAVYNARPNISSLTSESTLESRNQSAGQRVPIELIVEINGTLNSVKNNYFFRLPSSLDISSNSTLSYTINQINRNEQQKLLQATSILFTGQFIPTQGISNTPASLSQSFTKGANVINPLLSNQVISPLLSNQINALLNSDVSRLDVDFNLNAYNEVDLGIALRLYNDRLILRREGQITGGPQSSFGERIGDINATYRIQRGLSLTAFHRQDQVLSSLGGTGSGAGDVTPSVDGIGLESQIQYNSWNELMGRIKDFFNRLFGIDDENKQNNNAGNEPQTATAVNRRN